MVQQHLATHGPGGPWGSRATRRGLNLDQRETNGKNRYHKNSKIKMMFILVILFIFMFSSLKFSSHSFSPTFTRNHNNFKHLQKIINLIHFHQCEQEIITYHNHPNNHQHKRAFVMTGSGAAHPPWASAWPWMGIHGEPWAAGPCCCLHRPPWTCNHTNPLASLPWCATLDCHLLPLRHFPAFARNGTNLCCRGQSSVQWIASVDAPQGQPGTSPTRPLGSVWQCRSWNSF